MPSAAPVRVFALHLALAGALVGAGCVDIAGAGIGRYVEREEKHFAVSGKPAVSLKTFDGAIEIRTWDKQDVQVTIEKRGKSKAAIDTIEIRAEQDGNQITVEARRSDRHGIGVRFNDSRSVKLIVSMPPSGDLTAGSGDGSIDVDGVAGRIQLRSGDGSIHGHRVGGDLDVHTGDGTVSLSGRMASLRAHSGDGSVTIQADPGSTADGDWDISTGDGSVTLSIPDGFAAELDAHTGDGGITTEDIAVANVIGRIARNSLRGRLGNGGHSLRVRTGDGSITIRRS